MFPPPFRLLSDPWSFCSSVVFTYVFGALARFLEMRGVQIFFFLILDYLSLAFPSLCSCSAQNLFTYAPYVVEPASCVCRLIESCSPPTPFSVIYLLPDLLPHLSIIPYVFVRVSGCRVSSRLSALVYVPSIRACPLVMQDVLF